MYPQAPKKAAEELSWRDRLASLGNVRPLLRLVWETSPPLLAPSIVLRLFRALLPLATLWVAKLILDAAVGWVTRGRGTLVGVWKLVALDLGLAVASDVAGKSQHPARQPHEAVHSLQAERHPVASAHPGTDRLVVKDINFTLQPQENMVLI
jgi:hypothetical protein